MRTPPDSPSNHVVHNHPNLELRDAWWEWTPTNLGGSIEVYGDTVGQVRVSPRSERADHRYFLNGGPRSSKTNWRARALMMTAFHTLVVRDGLDPQVVHQEFLKINEYRRLISPDCEGAEEGSLERGNEGGAR